MTDNVNLERYLSHVGVYTVYPERLLLTLRVSQWSGCSFSENTKLCVAKLVTNTKPTVRYVSINQVDDGTEKVRKCMHCMIITVF